MITNFEEFQETVKQHFPDIEFSYFQANQDRPFFRAIGKEIGIRYWVTRSIQEWDVACPGSGFGSSPSLREAKRLAFKQSL